MYDNKSILPNSPNIKNIPEFTNHKITENNNVFVCLIGENSSYLTDISDMDNRLRATVAYNRISALPMLTPDRVGFYEDKYNNWLRSFKRKAVTSTTIYNEKQSEILGTVLLQTLEMFRKSRKQTTDSIEKNFALKLLFWYDFVTEDIVNNSRISDGVKIVSENVSKIQEYLFYYMLSLSGADVLLLQNKTDLDMPSKSLNISTIAVLGHLGNTDIPKFVKIHTQPTMINRQNITSPIVTTNNNNNIRVTIPPRHGRQSSTSQPTSPQQSNNIRVTIPPRPRRQSVVPQPIIQKSTQPQNPPYNPNNFRNTQPQRAEKSYEELARLASSVVQIFGIRRQNPTSDKFQIVGSGSGIMIANDGYILTNFHVAKETHEYAVKIENDEKFYFTNTLIKYHNDFDLAILRIDRKLTPLPIYKGTKPLVRGQKVVAIGSPEGLFNTVSDGIISAFRTINGVDMIQFTAPISSGSSGGAVLNMYGEVIGISTSGFDEGQNINFAVSCETILGFARGII